MKFPRFFLALLSTSALLSARTDTAVCGTHALRTKEAMFLHRQIQRKALHGLSRDSVARQATPPLPDSGNLAIIEDNDGVVATPNTFDLSGRSITFTPTQASASTYQYATTNSLFDASATAQSTVLTLGDDDTRRVELPFAFPYFGKSYSEIYVNSDGNLTFTEGDKASADRSLGRLVSGPPRIAPLYTDLDPSSSAGGVKTLAAADRFVVTWDSVRTYSDSGSGSAQTFQLVLYPDGRIRFSYNQTAPDDAVVGIAPGLLQGESTLVSFQHDPSGQYSSAVSERFTRISQIDIVTAAQKFYGNHEDAYDYIVIFNDEEIPASVGAVAYEVTVRNNRSGYGDVAVQDGPEYGSPRRLQAVLNMGPISQYPADPNTVVPSRAVSGDTTLTVLGHESGHLFLAYASVREPDNAQSKPMLGRQLAHWSFYFNSEASLLEGNRIVDKGENANPRFLTTATVQGYAPLDQYLMGFRPPEEVPDTFLARTFGSGARAPQVGVGFNGTRQNVTVNDIIAAEGRRTPDSTVAQRRFRFAFVIVTAAGKTPTSDTLARLENYRKLFEAAYGNFASGRASADAALKSAVQLSLAPAGGVLLGSTGTATISLSAPVSAPTSFTLRAPNGVAAFPGTVTIPTGKQDVTFSFTGAKAGVEELTAEPTDSRFETVAARVQVLTDASALTLAIVSGNAQAAVPNGALAEPVKVRVTDVNGLPYSNVMVRATPSSGGSLDHTAVLTGVDGVASFRWTTAATNVNQLALKLEAAPSVTVSATAAGKPAIAAPGAVNAASFAPGLAVGGIGSIFGSNLAAGLTSPAADQVQVLLNGQALTLYYVSDSQINFVVPQSIGAGQATLSVATPVGTTASLVPVAAVQAGIFQDANQNGAVLIAGTGKTTQQQPAGVGDVLEIYCTGLGAVGAADSSGLQRTLNTPTVSFGGRLGAAQAEVLYSGLSSVNGLYQVNVRVPPGLAGAQLLTLTIGGQSSNAVKVQLR